MTGQYTSVLFNVPCIFDDSHMAKFGQSNQIAPSVDHLLLYLKILPSTHQNVPPKLWKKMSNLLLNNLTSGHV